MSNYKTYLDGFQAGVYWCQKYGVPNSLPQEVKEDTKVLFTTSDGVEIKDPRTMVFGVTDDFEIVTSNGFTVNAKLQHRHFSSITLAQEYILNNKPCLSLQEVLQFVDAASHPSEENFREHELREYLKQKLKQ